MTVIIYTPELPKPATDGTVRRWLKNEGDVLDKGDVFLEIALERSLLEISASRPVRLAKKKALAGQTVRPGVALAEFDNATETGSSEKPTANSERKSMDSNANSNETIIAIPMPKAGNDMEEGTLVKWLVDEGAAIKPGDVLFEIETDKANMEIEAEYSGVIRQIVVKAGETVPVHTPLAYLGTTDSQAAMAASETPQPSLPAAPAIPALSGNESAGVGAISVPGPLGKVIPILMPKAGNDMEEGTVVKWLVEEGALVKEGDVLFELETDKATMEIESEHAGTIRRIIVGAGETVAIHTPLAYLAESEADVEAFIALGQGTPEQDAPALGKSSDQASGPLSSGMDAAASLQGKAPGPMRQAGEGRVKASPAARRLSSERGIDLGSVAQGSGPVGRILSSDLVAGAGLVKPAAALAPVSGEVRRYKMTPMRKAISRNLTASVQNAPHFYMRKTVEAVRLLEVYRRQKKACGASLNDLIVLAVSRTMMQFPAFRSRLDGEEVVEFPHASIGVAVGTDDGLRVPVLLNVDTMTLADLAAEARKVVQMARDGKAVNMGKGSFTISNLGMFGVEDFTAIINPPEAAILAVGAALEGIRVVDGAIRPTRQMTVTLSSDHRLIDGLLAARFLNQLQEFLENPEKLEG